MITDEELLAACLSAGRPGYPAYREAWRLYRQACGEWRERHTAALRAQAEQAVALALEDTARLTWAGLMRERSWRSAA